MRRYNVVGPEYLSTMGNSHQARPVAMVSENLATEFWGSSQSAIGRRIRGSPKERWSEVIAVAGNERGNGAGRMAPTIVSRPFSRRPSLAFVLRTPRAGATARMMRVPYERLMARTSFTLTMLSIVAGMALLLGVIDIHLAPGGAAGQRSGHVPPLRCYAGGGRSGRRPRGGGALEPVPGRFAFRSQPGRPNALCRRRRDTGAALRTGVYFFSVG